jgi:hypothetical protein
VLVRRRSGPAGVHHRLYNLPVRIVSLRTLLRKIAYWLAVVVISVALLVLLVLFFESRDSSDLENSQDRPAGGQVALVHPRPPAVWL